MLHKETKLFRAGDEPDFVNWIFDLWRTPFNDHIANELINLLQIHSAASRILEPTASPQHAGSVSRMSIQEAYALSAHTYYSAMLGRPVILEEGNFYPLKQPGPGLVWVPVEQLGTEAAKNLFAKCLMNLKNNGHQVVFDIPDRSLKGRLMGVAPFGFIGIKRIHPQPGTALTVPFIMLPSDFLDVLERYDHADILEPFADLVELMNHDWLHSITIWAITKEITLVNSWTSPARYLKTRNYDRFMENLKEQEKAPENNYNYFADYEDWLHRFQAEVLQDMASAPDNPVEQSVQKYLAAWKTLAKKSKNSSPMGNPEKTPAAYGIQLLAFFFVHALPKAHPLVQSVYNDPDVAPYAALIDNLYAHDIAKTNFDYAGREKISPHTAHMIHSARRSGQYATQCARGEEQHHHALHIA